MNFTRLKMRPSFAVIKVKLAWDLEAFSWNLSLIGNCSSPNLTIVVNPDKSSKYSITSNYNITDVLRDSHTRLM